MSEILFLILTVVLASVGVLGPVFLGWNAMIGLAIYAAMAVGIPVIFAAKKS